MSNNITKHEGFLIQSEVARIKGVTRQTVSLAVKQDRLPSHIIDGKRYIKQEDADAWVPLIDIKDRARYGMEVRWKGHTAKGPYVRTTTGENVDQVVSIDNPYMSNALSYLETNGNAVAKKRGRPKKEVTEVVIRRKRGRPRKNPAE